MKTITLALLSALTMSAFIHAEETLADKLRRAFDKTKDKVVEVADKVNTKSRSWFADAKENMRLSRPEYSRRAERTLSRFAAEIDVLKELAASAGQRDYFKTRVFALEQHLLFASTELQTLELSESEEVFRARQKGFDKTLWTLEAALGQAQEEVGL